MTTTVLGFGLEAKTTLTLLAIIGLSFWTQPVDGHGDHANLPFHVTEDANGCKTVIHTFNPLIHKSTYRVGVYNSEGDEVAHSMYDGVFQHYLTATAGQRFDPPLQFEVVPVDLTELMDLTDAEEMDFFFASSAVGSCMATEYKAQPLVTITNTRSSRGHSYDLDQYGGVMFTLNENNGIDSIQDFKDRTIGAGAITAMGGGQTQFYEMVNHGLSFVADPKQVVFTGDERVVVDGVLERHFEIGFARTDQIERHRGANGELLHDDTFKIINPQTHVLDDGTLFPFVSSTGLHPEWPVAALDHVDKGVSHEVQEALLALSDHVMLLDYNETLRCETTPELAALAKSASVSGAFEGFRNARSYFEVRTKQEKAGFIRADPMTGDLHCIRGDTLYHDIECPPHYYKVTEDEFHMSCELAGLECKEEYECYCQPCVKAFEVDVFQFFGSSSNGTENYQGCEKMELCGIVEQTRVVEFHLVDNLERDNAFVEVIIHLSDRDVVLTAEPLDEPYTYSFSWSGNYEGVGIMEIFVDGDQIPESPLRLQVVERQCDVDYAGQGKIADDGGTCVCPENTFDIHNNCVDSFVFAIVGSVVGVILVGIITFFYMRHKNNKRDELWRVHPEELHFDDPPETIGQGSFGVVLLAEYRGTKVAVKRALRDKKKGGSSRGGSAGRRVSTAARATIDSEVLDNTSIVLGNDSAVLSNDSVVLGNPSTGIIKKEDLLSTEDTSEGTPPSDTDLDLEAPQNPSPDIMDTLGATHSSRHFSVGFLTKEMGGGTSKWGFGSRKHKNQFKNLHESILGSMSASRSTHNFGRLLCPCFSDALRREEEFKTEMRVLSRLRHPCITTVMGAVITKGHDPVLVMEYMEYGSLHDLLRNDTMYLSGEIILQITRNLAQGLRFLHSSKPPILHGDLKARNILVDSRFRAKLCDFGLATKRDNSISGTPYWMAPEYLMGGHKYTTSCDIYAVGIILFEIYSRKSPYAGENYKDVIRGVCNGRVNKRPIIPNVTPPKFVEMMKKCWSPDISYRPQAKSLDMILMEMSDIDAEPLTLAQQGAMNAKRTGDLLYDIFPKRVADALKAGQKVEPEHHETVTVIFSDIIKFTEISRKIGPEKVCDMLDRLYNAFDACARRHQVFKVETIGDAWMGVTNLENDQEYTHVKLIAEMAVDMVNEAKKVIIDKEDPTKGYVNIRVGFHSGPVVSNVIGSLNKRYCLFGDTVNTASRMESNSKANRILCSERSYALLKEQLPSMKTKSGGKIAVKGKGDMKVYFIGDNLLRNKKRAEGNQEKTVGFVMDEPSEHPESETVPSDDGTDRVTNSDVAPSEAGTDMFEDAASQGTLEGSNIGGSNRW